LKADRPPPTLRFAMAAEPTLPKKSRYRPSLLLVGLLLPGCLAAAVAPSSSEGGSPDLATAQIPPSGRRLGANPYPGGVEFRLWAPNARAVAVSGDFAGGAAVPMQRDAAATYGVRVDGAKAGQRYRYLLTAADGTQLVRSDPYGRQLSGSDSLILDPKSYVWQSPPLPPRPLGQQVLYELHVGSFHCPAGSSSCTFDATTAKLPALSELGITAIELMPVNGHGGTNGWGYNPQSYFSPHPPFGSADSLRRLVDAAHQRGIAVILDVVYNHYDGWSQAPLRCFDGACDGNWSGIYFFSAALYRSTPWGPRFDFSKPEVADFIVDNIAAWQAEYRIDGFRWDSVSNIRAVDGQGSVPGGSELLARANRVAQQQDSGTLLIAEDLKGSAAVTAPSSRSGLGFASQWDGGFQYTVVSNLVGSDDSARNLTALRDALLSRYNGEPLQRVIYSENHDTVGNGSARLPSRIDPANPDSWAARKRSLLAAALLLTAPGVPMLFQGQEFLATGSFDMPPSPLDWTRRSTQPKIFTFYQDLIRLRRNLDGKSSGLTAPNIDVFHLNSGAKVLAYRRWQSSDDDVVVIANLSSKPFARYDIGLPAPGSWQVRVNSDSSRYSDDFTGAALSAITATASPLDGLPASGSLPLGPYSVVILSR
jgi:1,4-alpha-glucan branching enzyme